MDANPASLFPKVPTLKAEIGSNWTMAAWRGIAAPKGIPADVQAKLLASLKKAHDSKEFREFMTNRGFGVMWAPPAEFASFMVRSDADLGATMKAVGIAK
jgi:tripartite-type tricarboxylate transporter receptor subunit TctC